MCIGAAGFTFTAAVACITAIVASTSIIVSGVACTVAVFCIAAICATVCTAVSIIAGPAGICCIIAGPAMRAIGAIRPVCNATAVMCGTVSTGSATIMRAVICFTAGAPTMRPVSTPAVWGVRLGCSSTTGRCGAVSPG